MVRSLLVVPTGAGAGPARTCLGLVRALDRRGVNVAFVKPVAQPRADGGPDRSAALVAAITSLRPPDPLSTAELEQQLAERGLPAALEKIIAALEPVHDRSDVVVVEALTPGPARLYAIEINQALAQALDADVLLVTSWPAPQRRERRGVGAPHAGARAGPDRGHRGEPGGDTGHRGERVLVRRARARGRLRSQRRARGSVCGGSARRDPGTARAAPHCCGTASSGAELAAGG